MKRDGFKVYVLLFGALVVFTTAYVFLYPEVSSHFSRELNVHSSNLILHGRYYPLTLDGVDSVFLRSGKLVVRGFDVSGFRISDHREVERALPEGFSRFETTDDQWTFLDSSQSIEYTTIRTFVNRRSGSRFTIEFPFFDDQPHWRAYSYPGGSFLIVLAAGNWKRGENVYLGYVEVVEHSNS